MISIMPLQAEVDLDQRGCFVVLFNDSERETIDPAVEFSSSEVFRADIWALIAVCVWFLEA